MAGKTQERFQNTQKKPRDWTRRERKVVYEEITVSQRILANKKLVRSSTPAN